jgi:hypothetical protein
MALFDSDPNRLLKRIGVIETQSAARVDEAIEAGRGLNRRSGSFQRHETEARELEKVEAAGWWRPAYPSGFEAPIDG